MHCMQNATISNTHLTFSEDTSVITQNMVKDYRDIVTSITFPDSLTSIEMGAFNGCNRLTSVIFPMGLTTIGGYAFAGCTGLTSVTFPDNLYAIGNFAFNRCTGLTFVTFPASMTTIGNFAFDRCTGLTFVAFPDSLTTIEGYAFSKCTGLTHLNFPNNLTTIKTGAFSKCTGLSSITFSNSLFTIGSNAFEDCTGLTSVTFPDSLTTIGIRAFVGCTNLKCLIVPPSFADKDPLYWQRKGIDMRNTVIVTQEQSHDFQEKSSFGNAHKHLHNTTTPLPEEDKIASTLPTAWNTLTSWLPSILLFVLVNAVLITMQLTQIAFALTASTLVILTVQNIFSFNNNNSKMTLSPTPIHSDSFAEATNNKESHHKLTPCKKLAEEEHDIKPSSST